MTQAEAARPRLADAARRLLEEPWRKAAGKPSRAHLMAELRIALAYHDEAEARTVTAVPPDEAERAQDIIGCTCGTDLIDGSRILARNCPVHDCGSGVTAVPLDPLLLGRAVGPAFAAAADAIDGDGDITPDETARAIGTAIAAEYDALAGSGVTAVPLDSRTDTDTVAAASMLLGAGFGWEEGKPIADRITRLPLRDRQRLAAFIVGAPPAGSGVTAVPPNPTWVCGCLAKTTRTICEGCPHPGHEDICDVPTHPVTGERLSGVTAVPPDLRAAAKWAADRLYTTGLVEQDDRDDAEAVIRAALASQVKPDPREELR